MKNRHSLLSIPALALTAGMMIWGGSLNAQTTTPSDPQTPAQTQPAPDTAPTQTPQTQTPDTQSPQTQNPSQTPDATAPSTPSTPSTPDASKSGTDAPATTDVQSFSGTVVKSGDKYMFQEDSGTTYDIDHQDDVAKFEGKRVKVHGTLDPTGKKILLQ